MNRGLWMMLTPAALAVLAAAVWLFGGWQDPERWPIRWLEVEGHLERTTSAQVRAAVAAEARRGFFVVNVERSREAVEALPWVAAAIVGREWPDALRIEVIEHQPVARWNAGALVSRTGAVFEVAGTTGMQGLVQLSGPEHRQADVYQTWRSLSARMRASGIEIARLSLDPRGAWSVVLEDGLELLLGRDEVESRVTRFLAVHDRLSRVADIRRVDLRYPNGLAIDATPGPVNERPAEPGTERDTELAARTGPTNEPAPPMDRNHG